MSTRRQCIEDTEVRAMSGVERSALNTANDERDWAHDPTPAELQDMARMGGFCEILRADARLIEQRHRETGEAIADLHRRIATQSAAIDAAARNVGAGSDAAGHITPKERRHAI